MAGFSRGCSSTRPYWRWESWVRAGAASWLVSPVAALAPAPTGRGNRGLGRSLSVGWFLPWLL
ncbi:hypothetical protein H4N54_21075 [Limnospira fusiformis KN01]|uniref:hypothetical protein n=1 Tax=Limnospira fusiformis TaxID=54297 RepID=UPI0016587E60|nr:hypothetical protein [Limnospira fusiformis]ULB44879.1 hypothetical protein H4N54_21075 [Limnospira fusiformis KN01]